MEPRETDAIDKLFLELSQFTTATTKREAELESLLSFMGSALDDLMNLEFGDSPRHREEVVERCRKALDDWSHFS